VSRVTRFVLAHRRLVVGFWVVLTIVGIATPRVRQDAEVEVAAGAGSKGGL